jgi:hypothetical protein
MVGCFAVPAGAAGIRVATTLPAAVLRRSARAGLSGDRSLAAKRAGGPRGLQAVQVANIPELRRKPSITTHTPPGSMPDSGNESVRVLHLCETREPAFGGPGDVRGARDCARLPSKGSIVTVAFPRRMHHWFLPWASHPIDLLCQISSTFTGPPVPLLLVTFDGRVRNPTPNPDRPKLGSKRRPRQTATQTTTAAPAQPSMDVSQLRIAARRRQCRVAAPRRQHCSSSRPLSAQDDPSR